MVRAILIALLSLLVVGLLAAGVAIFQNSTQPEVVRTTVAGEAVYKWEGGATSNLRDREVCVTGKEETCEVVAFRGPDGRLYDRPTNPAQAAWWAKYTQGDVQCEDDPCQVPVAPPCGTDPCDPPDPCTPACPPLTGGAPEMQAVCDSDGNCVLVPKP